MKNGFSKISKRLLVLIAGVVLLFVFLIPAGMGLMMRGRMTQVTQFRNMPDIVQAPDAVPAPGSPPSQAPYNNDAAQVNPDSGFNGRFEREAHGRWQGDSQNMSPYDSGPQAMRGRGGFSPLRGIFGFFGGLVRLLGVVLLIAAGVVLLKRGTGSSSAAKKDSTDTAAGPEMTEEEIRAAMKRLGITKIEL